MNEICNDNRFELIKKYKNRLIECTNIETCKEEMEVLENIFFRLWQMGWLDILENYKKEDKTTNYDKIIEEINSELLSEIKKLKQNVNSYDRPWSEFFSANIKDLSETLKNIIIVKRLTKEE